MRKDILIYGANGYTAELIIDLALREGAKPVLAGRSAEKITTLAQRLHLPARIFALDDEALIATHLDGVAVVLNCAGPFSRTALPLARACIAAKIHYLDITGEIDVFEALAALDGAARAAGSMLLPGSGFDVVPSDCLAAHLKHRLPDASQLTLAFQAGGRPSHGTATTMVENLPRGGVVRREGKLLTVPAASQQRVIDLGRGPVATMSIPWGDVSTAWVSTGIPNITVFMAAPLALRLMSLASRHAAGLMGSALVQRLLKRQIDAAPAGPTPTQRAHARSLLWGEARNAAGVCVRSRLETLEGYTLTALTAWDIAKRCVGGEAQAGFRTPSLCFGADYILAIAGSARYDLPTD